MSEREFRIDAKSIRTIQVTKDTVVVVTVPEEWDLTEKEYYCVKETISILLNGAPVIVAPSGVSLRSVEKTSQELKCIKAEMDALSDSILEEKPIHFREFL